MAEHGVLAVIAEWQTIIGSAFAIGAAFIGGSYINRQIQQTDRIEEQRRRRGFLAARAVLPLALSALSGFVRQCSAGVREAVAAVHGGMLPRSVRPSFPAPPDGAIGALTRMIDTSGDDAVAVPIAMLLSEIQVLDSRLTDLATREQHRVVPRRELQEYLLELANIQMRIASIFDFARDEADAIPLNFGRGETGSALRIIGVYGQEADELEAIACRRWDRNTLKRLRSGERDADALEALVDGNPELVREELSIERAGELFAYRQHRYERLLDAATYALKAQGRPSEGPD